MANEREGVPTVPIAIFTFAIVCLTVFIVKWLNRKTSENKKDPIKHKEIPLSSQPKNDHKQKKKNVGVQKSQGSTSVNKFDHAHLITTLKGHTGALTGGDFSPSGKHFITASQVSPNSSELKIEENGLFNTNNAYEEDWISRSDVTPSDTEDSVTSSSSGGSKMTRRQRKNKKRKKKPAEMTKSQDCSDILNIEGLHQESCPLPNFDKFSPSFYVQQIGKSLRSLHKYLLPMCVGVQDRILSGYPFETQKGIYIYKTYPHARVDTVLVDQTLVSEETKDMKFQTETDEEISINFLRNQSNSEGGYSVGFTPKYNPHVDNNCVKRCIRCKFPFQVYYNRFSLCRYHSKKIEISGGGKVYFLCCGGGSESLGCEQSQCHVYHHLIAGLNGPLSGYKSTRPLNRESMIHSLDCEMVFTENGFEVGRATLISLEGKSLFDEYIKPEGMVYDYNTMFSGLTEECMVGAITFSEAQSRLLKLISSFDILIGHSLEGDLAVLQIVHRRVIDSSLMYQDLSSNEPTFSQPNFRSASPLPRRQGLKFLVHKHFGEVIQNHEMGHNSYEDAVAALNLVLLRVMEETVKLTST